MTRYAFKIRVSPPASDNGITKAHHFPKTNRKSAEDMLRMMANKGFRLGDAVSFKSPVDGVQQEGRWSRIFFEKGKWHIAVRLGDKEQDSLFATKDTVEKWIKEGQFVRV